MTKQEFSALTREKILFLDGATGSNLMRAGMPSGVCPEQWILDNQETLIRLQEAYVQAGSNILYAPTFSANRIKLAEYGLQDHQREMIHQLVALSRQAAGNCAYIAGDLTMTGEQLAPIGKMAFEDLIDIYKEQITYLCEAGVDLLVVETMMSLQETRAALIAAKEVCELPILATMTFEKDGRTLYGTDALTAGVVLASLGADGVGINCSTGPDSMAELVRAMAEAVSVPIIAKPNAGLPFLNEQGVTCYDMDAKTFVVETEKLLQAGATILGGCCGTTPEYIEGLVSSYAGEDIRKYRDFEEKKGLFLTSERQTLSFGLKDPFIVVGERINPTGKKKLQQELREENFDLVTEFAQQQEQAGAKVLDVNVGMSGVDEKALMLKTLDAVMETTNLPLAIDSSHVEVLEAALRLYPGRALVNSVSLEKDKMERLLPIIKKYGAMFILLPLSDAGLPKNLDERVSIITTIYEQALSLGLTKKDFVVDGLVATVGAQKDAALQTLNTISYCRKQEIGTICGLSNISFGMPSRSFVNSAFLTMAIQNGLTMAIANPCQELLMGAALASDLLLAKEEADIHYIDFAGRVSVTASKNQEKNQEKSPTAEKETGSTEEPQEETSIRETLRNAVLKGNQKKIGKITQDALEQGEDAEGLLNEVLLPAINQVGEYFEKGIYFLPQLIASAEAMKLSIEILEDKLVKKQTGKDMPTVVVATVEGDIHDIGKNLVVLMLKNYGFHVIDLGKNVNKETIIEAAIEHNAALIGLSALMTTTMQKMKEVVAYAKEKGVKAKIMIGGAVITKEYADEIGADGYSKDAADAVKLAKQLLNLLL